MTIQHTRIARFMRTVAVITAVVVLPASAFAQSSPAQATAGLKDARWQPWLGCWTPVERAPRDRDIQVCVTAAADGLGVQLTTFAGEQRILQDAIAADGSSHPIREDGCSGSSRSLWARNAARLFRVIACDNNPPQRTAEIATLENADEWLDVQVVSAGGNENVRTRRYVRSSLAPPSEVRDHVSALVPGRVAAPNSRITVNDVIEAHTVVSTRAVEAWLSESDAQVPVHKDTLIALQQAKVPPNVIDLMVARAYPSHFEVHRSGGGGGGGGSVGTFFDDLFWTSAFDLMFDPYAFYYSPFGSYHGYVDPSYYAYGGYVIVPAEPGGGAGGAQDSSNARVVNGMGYTRVEPRAPAVFVGPRSPGATADSYDSGSSSSSGGSSSSSSSGGGSASSSGYSAGGGGSQTAVPR